MHHRHQSSQARRAHACRSREVASHEPDVEDAGHRLASPPSARNLETLGPWDLGTTGSLRVVRGSGTYRAPSARPHTRTYYLATARQPAPDSVHIIHYCDAAVVSVMLRLRISRPTAVEPWSLRAGVPLAHPLASSHPARLPSPTSHLLAIPKQPSNLSRHRVRRLRPVAYHGRPPCRPSASVPFRPVSPAILMSSKAP